MELFIEYEERESKGKKRKKTKRDVQNRLQEWIGQTRGGGRLLNKERSRRERKRGGKISNTKHKGIELQNGKEKVGRVF